MTSLSPKVTQHMFVVGGDRKSSEAEEHAARGRSRTSSVSDEGGFNEPSPEVVARLRPADYRDPHPPLTSDIRDAERARSDPDTLSVLQQVNALWNILAGFWWFDDNTFSSFVCLGQGFPIFS